MSENVYPSAFTKFIELPIELRYIIWELNLPDDIPEICIPWPLEEVPSRWEPEESASRRTKYLQPLLVDTAYPTLMHVCRESRELAQSQTRFRYSPIAGCFVPFRTFRPDLDILYVTLCRPPTDINVVPRWGMYPESAQHLALDLHTIKDGSFLWILIGNRDVRTVSCVLPASKAILDTAARFRPPVRRCRLRKVEQPSDGSQSHIIYVDRGFDRRMTGMGRYLEEVRDYVGAEFAEILEIAAMPEEYLRRWNAPECRFDVEFLAQTFEEYRGGKWVPSSDHVVRFDFQCIIFPASRAVVDSTRTYRVSDEERWTPLRNPETFRVNDIQQTEVPFE